MLFLKLQSLPVVALPVVGILSCRSLYFCMALDQIGALLRMVLIVIKVSKMHTHMVSACMIPQLLAAAVQSSLSERRSPISCIQHVNFEWCV